MHTESLRARCCLGSPVFDHLQYANVYQKQANVTSTHRGESLGMTKCLVSLGVLGAQ